LARGAFAARQILRDNPVQRILVLTDVESEKVIRDCLEAGVRGWISKSDGTHDLTRAVEALEQHSSIFSARVSDLLMSSYLDRPSADRIPVKVCQLSPREREVVQLLAEGKTSKEVGVILNIAAKTAETHRSNIMIKLKLHSIAELVLYAVRNEIVRVQFPTATALSERGDGTASFALQDLN
jgi:DNA-binding NarL/FixJ family response regulator